MLHHVAVVHEASQDRSARKCDSQIDRLTGRNAYGIYVAVECLWLTVTADHLEVDLMDVKDVHFIGWILDRPLFNVSERDAGVDEAVIERASIDIVLLVLLAEDDRTKCVDVCRRKVLTVCRAKLRVQCDRRTSPLPHESP